MLTERLEEELSLLKRHLEVLESVEGEGPIGIRRLAEETGLTRSKVRYSLRVLEKEGFVEPSKQGAEAADADLEEVRTGLSAALDEVKALLESLPEKD